MTSPKAQGFIAVLQNQLLDWTWNVHVSGISIEDTPEGRETCIRSSGSDPFGISPLLVPIDLNDFDRLEVDIQTHVDSHLQLFWMTPMMDNFKEEASVRIKVRGDGIYRTLSVLLPKNEIYNRVIRLRVDPMDTPGEIRIRRLALVNDEELLRAKWSAHCRAVSWNEFSRLLLGTTWMYPFKIADGVVTRVHFDELTVVHEIRNKMLFSVLDTHFKGRWNDMDCLDVACNEGFFSFELNKRGARSVYGLDIRPENIERADFLRRIWGISEDAVSFEVKNLFALSDLSAPFDCTLFFGILYHIEDPVGALRLMRRLTKEICVIETQITRQETPIISGFGRSSEAYEHPASFALRIENDTVGNPLAAAEGILSLIPNHQAVLDTLKAVGFSKVERITPPEGAPQSYRVYDRAVYAAYV
jgi:tRNA (mo5U34)-methyltransferase